MKYKSFYNYVNKKLKQTVHRFTLVVASWHLLRAEREPLLGFIAKVQQKSYCSSSALFPQTF